MGPDAANGGCGLGTISRDTYTWTLEVSILDHGGSGPGPGPHSVALMKALRPKMRPLGVGQELTHRRENEKRTISQLLNITLSMVLNMDR